MSESSMFFNSFEGDRAYTAAEFVSYFASFIGNGVFWGGNALKVNVYNGMDVQVLVGRGFINGYYYKNEGAAKVLTISPAHAALPRIDRVVLQLDLTQAGRRISAVVKTGEAKQTPVAPALQRDNAFWELGLADIRVNAGTKVISQSNITDLRLDAGLCGVVAALINQPDLTAIFNQYQAKYAEVCSHWDTYFDQTKVQWQDMKQLYEGWFNQVKAELYAQASTDFDDWSRRSGYNMVTTFFADGHIEEKIINRFNQSVLATRTTYFFTQSIGETIYFTDANLQVTKISSFSGNTITETID